MPKKAAICEILYIFVAHPLALPVSAKSYEIRVKFTEYDENGPGKTSYGSGDSFSLALDDSDATTGNVGAIEVTNGKITAADWDYIGVNISHFSGLTDFTVNDSVYPVANIADYTFSQCTSLTDVNIQSEIAIGDFAFQNCSNLNNLQIPKVTFIGNSAFYKCEGLEELDMPKVTSIGTYAFYLCESLEQLEVPKVTVLEPSAFGLCNNLLKVELPELITMGEGAFSYCSKLYEISIPKVTDIGERAFYACVNLDTLKVPEAPPTVANEAFFGCADFKKPCLCRCKRE